MNKKMEKLNEQIRDIEIKLNDPRLCHGTLDTQTRVSGYYRSLVNLNKGKVEEVKDRLLYRVC